MLCCAGKAKEKQEVYRETLKRLNLEREREIEEARQLIRKAKADGKEPQCSSNGKYFLNFSIQ